MGSGTQIKELVLNRKRGTSPSDISEKKKEGYMRMEICFMYEKHYIRVAFIFFINWRIKLLRGKAVE